MKKILFATDFSENAEKSFAYALNIAAKNRADLIMLHVFDIPTSVQFPHTENPLEMEKQAINDAENKLKGLFEKYNVDINVEYITVENTSVAKGVLSTAKDKEPGLVVVGTKGGSKVKEAIVGSTTKTLINQCPIPVLAIPENAHYRGLNKVVYATDFREDDILAIQQLIDFIEPFDPEITVVHVSTPKEYKGDEKMEWFKNALRAKTSKKGIKFQLLLADNIYERLQSYIKRYEFDLLVMLEKERNGLFDRLFHRDLVKRLEFHTSTPVMSFSEHFLHLGSKENFKSSGIIN